MHLLQCFFKNTTNTRGVLQEAKQDHASSEKMQPVCAGQRSFIFPLKQDVRYQVDHYFCTIIVKIRVIIDVAFISEHVQPLNEFASCETAENVFVLSS